MLGSHKLVSRGASLRIISKFHILSSIALFIWLSPFISDADTLVFKDGAKVEAEAYWMDGQTLKYQKYGAVVGTPLEKVERIIKSDPWADGVGPSKMPS